jgi:dihydrofolate synthase/folylpolyglutamate synthase
LAERLADWLERLESRTPESNIRLGLDRVSAVLNRLPDGRPRVPVITVGGTNGKGSVVAMLESIYTAGGYRVLAYTSPHLLSFSERIRIDKVPVDETRLICALDDVEACRGSIALTYFEHVTLAALRVAAMTQPDILILEVGLGGRLDAVNAVDPDVAVITSIGLDHVDWLGGTRRSIATEKGGIARPGKPLIVGERRPPAGWIAELEAGKAKVALAGRDFRWLRAGRMMRLLTDGAELDLPPPGLPGRHQWGNAACAVMAALALQPRLPVSPQALATGLREAAMPGRMQKLREHPTVWVDVAHNLQSAQALADMLKTDRMPTTAVFSALAGKDITAIGSALSGQVDRWIVPPLASDRALPTREIAESLERGPVGGVVETVESMPQAIQRAFAVTPPEGRIVAFGSFRTVAEAWPLIQTRE